MKYVNVNTGQEIDSDEVLPHLEGLARWQRVGEEAEQAEPEAEESPVAELNAGQAASLIRSGEYDEHLGAIEAIDSRKTVVEAVEARRRDLEED